jgi:hypothetical protein
VRRSRPRRGGWPRPAIVSRPTTKRRIKPGKHPGSSFGSFRPAPPFFKLSLLHSQGRPLSLLAVSKLASGKETPSGTSRLARQMNDLAIAKMRLLYSSFQTSLPITQVPCTNPSPSRTTRSASIPALRAPFLFATSPPSICATFQVAHRIALPSGIEVKAARFLTQWSREMALQEKTRQGRDTKAGEERTNLPARVEVPSIQSRRPSLTM